MIYPLELVALAISNLRENAFREAIGLSPHAYAPRLAQRFIVSLRGESSLRVR